MSFLSSSYDDQSQASVDATSAAKITSTDETFPEVNGGAVSTAASHELTTSDPVATPPATSATDVENQENKDLKESNETQIVVEKMQELKSTSEQMNEQEPRKQQETGPSATDVAKPSETEPTSIVTEVKEIPPQEASSLDISSPTQEPSSLCPQETIIEDGKTTEETGEVGSVTLDNKDVKETPAPPTPTPAEPVDLSSTVPSETISPLNETNETNETAENKEAALTTDVNTQSSETPLVTDVSPTQKAVMERNDSIFSPDRIIEEVTAEGIKMAVQEITTQKSIEEAQQQQPPTQEKQETDQEPVPPPTPAQEPPKPEEPTPESPQEILQEIPAAAETKIEVTEQKEQVIVSQEVTKEELSVQDMPTDQQETKQEAPAVPAEVPAAQPIESIETVPEAST